MELDSVTNALFTILYFIKIIMLYYILLYYNQAASSWRNHGVGHMTEVYCSLVTGRYIRREPTPTQCESKLIGTSS